MIQQMKSIVICLVVVIVALGGLQVAQSEDLKQIQDEFKQEVDHYLHKLTVSPNNTQNIRFSRLEVSMSQDKPEWVYLYADELDAFPGVFNQEFEKELCCKIATNYQRRTGFPYTYCKLTYYYSTLHSPQLWTVSYRFGGNNCSFWR